MNKKSLKTNIFLLTAPIIEHDVDAGAKFKIQLLIVN